MSRNPITIVCIAPITFEAPTNQAAKVVDPSGADWLGPALRVAGQGGAATHKCFHVLLTYDEAEAYCERICNDFGITPIPHDSLEHRKECLDQLTAATAPYGYVIAGRDEAEGLGPLHLWEVVEAAGFEAVTAEEE